jgi:ketosteroid isomerase-like protein
MKSSQRRKPRRFAAARPLGDFYTGALEAFEGLVSDDVELIDAGAEKVVTLYRGEVRGRAGGANVEVAFSYVVTFRDGKILRDQWFSNRPEALEAAGLRE